MSSTSGAKDLESGGGGASSGAQSSGGTYNSKRMQMAQAQVNDVIDVMKVSQGSTGKRTISGGCYQVVSRKESFSEQ